tara:strand:- start:315 stop:803 length:489 start_codon:yes stop_codon:yes gene_type:complete
MAAFNRTYRQQIVDEYMNDTGANSFIPAAFLEWLQPQTDHRVYSVFFGKDDEEAAWQYRLHLARNFVAGLRIRVAVSETEVVKVPAFISPISERKAGGGYVTVDWSDGNKSGEVYRQAAADLERWIKRYEGVCGLAGLACDRLPELVAELRIAADKAEKAAA